MVSDAETHNWPMHREYVTVACSATNRAFISHPSPLKLRDYDKKGEVIKLIRAEWGGPEANSIS